MHCGKGSFSVSHIFLNIYQNEITNSVSSPAPYLGASYSIATSLLLPLAAYPRRKTTTTTATTTPAATATATATATADIFDKHDL